MQPWTKDDVTTRCVGSAPLDGAAHAGGLILWALPGLGDHAHGVDQFWRAGSRTTNASAHAQII